VRSEVLELWSCGVLECRRDGLAWRLELGKLVGDQEPEFEGAFYGAASVQADVGNPALDGVVQARRVLRQSGGFEGE
jgi:hypothetical protein